MKNLFSLAILVALVSSPAFAADESSNSSEVKIKGLSKPYDFELEQNLDGSLREVMTIDYTKIDNPNAGTPSKYLNSEANSNIGFGQIKAQYSQARGYDGRVYNRKADGSLYDTHYDDLVKVGIIDTGIDATHPDLDYNVRGLVTCTTTNGCTMGSRDNDNYGHGTTVAGIIAARRNNVGMVGIAPNVKLYGAAAIGITNGSDQDAVKFFSDNGIKVINASYGISSGVYEYPIVSATKGYRFSPVSATQLRSYITAAGKTTNFVEAVNNAVSKGVIFVFAAGNASMDQVNVLAGLPYYFRGNISSKPSGYSTVNPKNYDWSKNWVAAVSVNSSNQLSSFSNACGVAKDYCLAAPGENIYSTKAGGGYTTASITEGTSFSAPSITGSIAALLGAFPQLKSTDALQILFDTATDLGAPGVDAIYGHGLVNLDKATSPSDSGWKLATATLGVTTMQSFDASRVNLSSSFGDALSKSKTSLMFVDSYNKDYTISLADLTNNAKTTSDISQRLSGMGESIFDNNITTPSGAKVGFSMRGNREDEPKIAGENSDSKLDKMMLSYDVNGKDVQQTTKLAYGMNPNDVSGFSAFSDSKFESSIVSGAFKNPYLGLTNNAKLASTDFKGKHLNLKTTMFTGDVGSYENNFNNDKPIKGAYSELGYANNGMNLSVGFGTNRESKSFLGADGSGAFNLGNTTDTYYGTAAMKYSVNNKLSFLANYNYGVTNLSDTKNSIFKNVSNLKTDSFAVGAEYKGLAYKDDSVLFAVSQPMRVENGKANLMLPMDILADNEVIYQNRTLSLAPQGRELDMEAYYSVNTDEDSNLKLGSVLRLEPNNMKDAQNEGIFMAKYGMKF